MILMKIRILLKEKKEIFSIIFTFLLFFSCEKYKFDKDDKRFVGIKDGYIVPGVPLKGGFVAPGIGITIPSLIPPVEGVLFGYMRDGERCYINKENNTCRLKIEVIYQQMNLSQKEYEIRIPIENSDNKRDLYFFENTNKTKTDRLKIDRSYEDFFFSYVIFPNMILPSEKKDLIIKLIPKNDKSLSRWLVNKSLKIIIEPLMNLNIEEQPRIELDFVLLRIIPPYIEITPDIIEFNQLDNKTHSKSFEICNIGESDGLLNFFNVPKQEKSFSFLIKERLAFSEDIILKSKQCIHGVVYFNGQEKGLHYTILGILEKYTNHNYSFFITGSKR